MPVPAIRPHPGATHSAARRPLAAGGRIALAAMALATVMAIPEVGQPATVMAIPEVGQPPTVAADGSCTGWRSQTLPPKTIRVLRTLTGRVERVDFRRYVAEVMASGEWPSYLHTTTLEVGAVATKQYAWYYAMRGHHRPYYHRNGRCYDVRDDTTDQLYRPEKSRPSPNQRRAIDSTWGLSLRKYGRFFLTGYRAGVAGECAADANGWKLYARSVEACAQKGWSRQRLQRTYLGPNLSFVWSPVTGPVLSQPLISLRAGNVMPEKAVTISWKPTVTPAGVGSYKLQRQVGKRDWQDIAVPGSKARQARVWLKTGMPNRFRIRATDGKGRTGPWAYSDDRTAALRGPVGLRLGSTRLVAGRPDRGSQVGRAQAHKGHAGKAHARRNHARRAHAGRALVSFTGRSVAFVSRTGPGMGKARIFVDGERVATVDLERQTTTSRKLVWARNLGSLKRHTIAVKAVGPDRPVHFQGFYVLR